MDATLSRFIERVHSQYFSHFPIEPTGEGDYAGRWMKYRIHTRFSTPQAGVVIAVGRFFAPTGEETDLTTLLRLCRVSERALVLDRFVRSVHLLNLSRYDSGTSTVYLPVSMALVAGVNANHGAVFRAIVDRLELDRPLGILLPTALRRQPAHYRSVAAAYHANGFATAPADAWPLAARADRENA
jgi:hypothetical protein